MDPEAVVVALALVAVTAPLAVAAFRRWSGAVGVCVTLALAVAAVGSAWAVRQVNARRLDPIVDRRPVEARSDGYVSSDSCRACHPGEYASWHASYHRTMTQYATPQTVRAPFDGAELRDRDGTYRLERRGAEFWVDMPDPAWRGDPRQRPRAEKRIAMITGSHHYQVYWYPSGNSRIVWAFPFIYMIEDRRWIPRGAAFLGPEERTRNILGVWNNSCIKCHSTRGQPEPDGRGGLETHVVELGIACEACHGPAGSHVEIHRDPLQRYEQRLVEQADASIVQPERLPHRAASQVCGQCHGIWRHFEPGGWNDWLENGLGFRPGQELGESVMLVRHNPEVELPYMQAFVDNTPSYKMERQFWSDGMVRVSGREYNGLIDSPCFERGELSCLSCHEMHQSDDDPRDPKQWGADQLKPGLDTDRACLQCHERFETNLRDHTHHEPESEGSRCYNCHMPHTTYGLLKGIRSHEIDSPSVAASLETGRPNACNHCHLDQPLAWAARYLEKWYGQPRPELTADERTIAASLLLMLRGDAGQRALTAWAMGWGPARETSGDAWMAPHLAPLLDDPYQAVRYIAGRSLRRLPGFDDFDYDFLAPPAARDATRRRALERWEGFAANRAALPDPGRLLLDGHGGLRRLEQQRLLARRDDRDVELHE